MVQLSARIVAGLFLLVVPFLQLKGRFLRVSHLPSPQYTPILTLERAGTLLDCLKFTGDLLFLSCRFIRLAL